MVQWSFRPRPRLGSCLTHKNLFNNLTDTHKFVEKLTHAILFLYFSHNGEGFCHERTRQCQGIGIGHISGAIKVVGVQPDDNAHKGGRLGLLPGLI